MCKILPRAHQDLSKPGVAELCLLKRVCHLQMTQANIEKQAAKTQENVRSSVETVAQLQEALDAASGKYTFLQQLRGYVADLCDMLQVAVHTLPSCCSPNCARHLFVRGGKSYSPQSMILPGFKQQPEFPNSWDVRLCTGSCKVRAEVALAG